jgi:predicted phage terminase large subunit-like protein
LSLVDIEGPWTLQQIEAALQIAALSPTKQRATLAAAQQKQAAEDSLRAFVEQAWDVLEPGTKFIPGVHVDAVCEHLQAMIEGRLKDLIINIPPGFAKSMIGAVFFPAWVWIKRPEYRFLFSSYKAEYAVRDSVKCRSLIQSNWYQERWSDRFKLKSDQNEKGKFENDHTGYRETTSVATGTGARAMLVCCDDPTSVDQAASDAERNRANSWWTGTMTTRLNDLRTGHLLLIQQRLHEEDTTAVSIEQGGYQHLYLPNEFEADRACVTHTIDGAELWKDPRTKEGQLLWPAKVGPEEVTMLKRKLGSYGYSGQYQQRPSPAGGGIFKKHWWKYWTYKTISVSPVLVRLADGTMMKIHPVILPDKFDSQVQSWDMAFKDLATSDYVAGGVWGTKGADRYLLDQTRERLGFPETVQAVKKMSKKWLEANLKLVEDKANGPAVIQSLRHEIPGLVAVIPDGGKVARAQAVSPQVESGNVYLPHPAIAPWVEAFVEECATFPNGKYDDQVDQMTQALNRLRAMVVFKNPLPPPRPPTGDRGWMA